MFDSKDFRADVLQPVNMSHEVSRVPTNTTTSVTPIVIASAPTTGAEGKSSPLATLAPLHTLKAAATTKAQMTSVPQGLVLSTVPPMQMSIPSTTVPVPSTTPSTQAHMPSTDDTSVDQIPSTDEIDSMLAHLRKLLAIVCECACVLCCCARELVCVRL